MNSSNTHDSEIIRIIDKEISNGTLEHSCKVQAELDSNGNYDLMISRYFLLRLESLQKSHVTAHHTKVDELEKRKMASATHLVRYRVSKDPIIQSKKKKRVNEILLSTTANLILFLGSISAISAFMILSGYTLYNLPYLAIALGVVVCLSLPFTLSKLPIKNNFITYQSALAAVCIITCMGSAGFGILVMKKNPPNYTPPSSQLAQQPVQPASQQSGIQLQPASTESSVADNR